MLRQARTTQLTRSAGAGRWLAGALLLFGLVLSLGGVACGDTGYVCEGNHGTCSEVAPEHCEQVGFSLASTPVCVTRGYACEMSNLDGSECKSSNCFRDQNGSCRTICSALDNAVACAQKGGKCQWLGETCTTKCETISDASDCAADASCLWLSCGGMPRDCGSFSGDECPTFIGCERVKRGSGYSTQ